MTHGGAAQVIVARDDSAYFRRAADLFIVAARKSKRPSVALSGGTTPKRMFEYLATSDMRFEVAWGEIEFFWGDERCVPPDHPDSNYRMAHEALLSKVPVNPARIHRMKGELDPSAAAAAYEKEMAGVLSDRPFPRLDLNLLGMGEDGHTASLFPGTAALDETRKWVAANRVDKLGADRITMTLPVLNNARRTVVLVTGSAKAGVVGEVFSGAGRYPIERVHPVDGEITWLLDAEAAERLPASVRASATYI